MNANETPVGRLDAKNQLLGLPARPRPVPSQGSPRARAVPQERL